MSARARARGDEITDRLTKVVTLILVICTTAIHLWLLTTRKYGLSFHQALATADGVGSAVAFMITILVVWPVGALFLYHARVRRRLAPHTRTRRTVSLTASSSSSCS